MPAGLADMPGPLAHRLPQPEAFPGWLLPSPRNAPGIFRPAFHSPPPARAIGPPRPLHAHKARDSSGAYFHPPAPLPLAFELFAPQINQSVFYPWDMAVQFHSTSQVSNPFPRRLIARPQKRAFHLGLIGL